MVELALELRAFAVSVRLSALKRFVPVPPSVNRLNVLCHMLLGLYTAEGTYVGLYLSLLRMVSGDGPHLCLGSLITLCSSAIK